MITVLLIDDQSVFLEGAKALLSGSEEIHFVGEASDLAGAIEAFQRLRPMVTGVSLDLDDGEGFSILAALQRADAEARLFAMGMRADGPSVLRAMQAGAAGYYSKREDSAALGAAIRYTAEDRRYLSVETREELLDGFLSEQLTPRELQILSSAAVGNSNKVIARDLGITEATVKSHVHQVLRKLGVVDRTGAVTRALQLGLIAVPSRGATNGRRPHGPDPAVEDDDGVSALPLVR